MGTGRNQFIFFSQFMVPCPTAACTFSLKRPVLDPDGHSRNRVIFFTNKFLVSLSSCFRYCILIKAQLVDYVEFSSKFNNFFHSKHYF
jgi:hypothetical protein